MPFCYAVIVSSLHGLLKRSERKEIPVVMTSQISACFEEAVTRCMPPFRNVGATVVVIVEGK